MTRSDPGGNNLASPDSEFDRLIAPLRKRMVHSIWRVVRDADAAEDVVQEVCISILKNLKRIRKHPRPEALILRTCVNRAIDYLRTNRRRRECSVPYLEETDQRATQDNPAESLAVRQRHAHVMAAIGRLPPREAEAIVLYAVEDLAYPDIASAMGCREATVRVLVSKARKRLRAEFGRIGLSNADSL